MVEPATAHVTATPPAEPVDAADAYVAALLDQGVSHLFLNPGTDTFPVQEAIARRQALGLPTPTVVLCPFEVVALAAAHGFYAASGRPQAVLVHVDVGTQNLGAMLHNAQRGRAAVFISAGRAPYTTDPAIRGTRDTYIHWLQEQRDQHGIVRNYVKWEYEVRRPDQLGEAIARAFQVACSDPPGPVYLTLPREVLMAPDVGQQPQPNRFAPARLGAGDPAALERIAEWLVQAERPLVLTSAVGRTSAGWDGLLQLADLLALPVIEWRSRANFPSTHPLHLGYNYGLETGLEEADLVLVLDHDVPYIPTRRHPHPDARIVALGLDPLNVTIPLWSFPVDLAVPCDTAQALPLLAEMVAERLRPADHERLAKRRAAYAAQHAALRAQWEKDARAQANMQPIGVSWLGACLEQLRQEHPDLVVVDEAVTSQVPLYCQMQVERPGSWFQSGGSGLGWGLGAALGVKLALPDRPVMALVGDGSFLFGAPEAMLWTASQVGAPVLVVICNNACYNATLQPLRAAYPTGFAVQTGQYPGITLTPPPDFAKLAEATGAYGERVEDPAMLLPALRRGIERTLSGQSAVLDVILARP